MLDVLIFSMIMTIVVVFALMILSTTAADRFVALTEGTGGMVLSAILAYVMAIVPAAFLLAVGQTPGKWLFGVRVRGRDGRRMGLLTAMKRELHVWVRGVGLGIPVISLFTLIMSHGDLKNEGVTPWDKSLDLVVEHAPATPWWWIRATIGAAIVLAASLWSVVDSVLSLGQ
jgi:uncharacterized RDD family membrane protein YckC